MEPTGMGWRSRPAVQAPYSSKGAQWKRRQGFDREGAQGMLADWAQSSHRESRALRSHLLSLLTTPNGNSESPGQGREPRGMTQVSEALLQGEYLEEMSHNCVPLNKISPS